MRMTPQTTDFTLRMFVETADRNYILARLAYFNQLHLDFWWLSHHAIEKYLKAILLLNGCSVKKPSHDVVKLHLAVKKQHPMLDFGPLVDPKIENLCWRDRSVENFLVRLGEYGQSSNRYLTYGYTVTLDDLMKVDQLVWSVRRHCRSLREKIEVDGRPVEIDRVDQLRQHPECWALGGFRPLENLVEGKTGEELKETFLRLNTPFAPNVEHCVPKGLWLAFSNSPLATHCESLRSPNAIPETKTNAADVLQWALTNIYFEKDDKCTIKKALAA